ncbi:uncharacterized protein BXZ73DRAFT_96146 [Epithele typhae]|uniref:uncharacterized protein n=1 Tax=Epithele typhae TaxID=378194 RepID=UPI00200798CA|nr:uncharacterized protein BXZ73DRAFT_96146 [Epithele typhae]KAH9945156.1 hypothetical protein BXZ73DRAFT_96146 [Epithele typhae]
MFISLEVLYYQMLGAKIKSNVVIDSRLLNIVNALRFSRDGTFNTYTQLAPGAVIPDGATYGPHVSSHDDPSPDLHVQYSGAAPPLSISAPTVYAQNAPHTHSASNAGFGFFLMEEIHI